MLDEDVDGVQLWSRRMKMRILIVFAMAREGENEDIKDDFCSRKVKTARRFLGKVEHLPKPDGSPEGLCNHS